MQGYSEMDALRHEQAQLQHLEANYKFKTVLYSLESPNYRAHRRMPEG